MRPVETQKTDMQTSQRDEREALQRTVQELQQVFSAAAPLVAISCDHEILMINDSLCAMLEISLDQLQDWKCYDIFHQARCDTLTCPLQQILETPERVQYELTVETVSGQSLDLLGTATPLFDENYMEVTGIVVSFMEISEQKRAYERVEQAYVELARANQELKDMQTHLVQNEKLAAIGQLAAGVAHEMNTPVGFVASNFETLWHYIQKLCTVIDAQQKLMSQAACHSDSTLQLQVQAIQSLQQKLKLDFVLEDLPAVFAESREGIDRVTEIIQNLRDFSRIDQAEDVDSFDLNEAVRSTLMVACNDIKQDTDVNLDLGDIPLVYGHAGQINQVVLNILLNAVQAIRMQAMESQGLIRVRTYVEDEYVVCEIADNGPGIPDEIKNKVFDPFFTTKPVGKGTGLGLSISHDIVVNKHHGELAVTSKPDQGTTFAIRLPRDTGLHCPSTREEVAKKE